MANQPLTTTVSGWKFARVSAEYVDISPPGSRDAVDCIGIYDYAKGETTLAPNDRKGLRLLAKEWLDENADVLSDYAALCR